MRMRKDTCYEPANYSRALSDIFRGAQLNETLSRLYIGTEEYERAQELIWQAIRVFEHTDAEAILAEALTTSGIVSSRLGRFSEAKRSFEGAYKISERCSDNEGAGLALLTMFEELGDRLDSFRKDSGCRKVEEPTCNNATKIPAGSR